MNETPPAALRRRTLHQQFVRMMLLPLVAAFLFASGFTVLVSYELQHEQQQSARSQVVRIYERSLHKPLWHCDSDTARGIVDTLVHLPEVAGVRLQDICADDFITAGDATEVSGAGADRLQIPVIYQDNTGRSFSVGQLDMRFHSVSLASGALGNLWRYGAIF